MERSLKDIITQKKLTVKEVDGKLASKMHLSLTSKKDITDYYAKAEDLQKIKSPVKMQEDQVFVFELEASDMKVDRSDEHFSKQAQEKMLALAIKNRIPVLLGKQYDHEWKASNTKGIVFDGYVSEDGVLTYKAFFPAIESNKDVIAGLMTGLYNKLSVGFSLDPIDYVCDSCDKPIIAESCPHMPGMVDEKGNKVTVTIKDVLDNYEVSIVAVPCQPDTNVKSAEDLIAAKTKSIKDFNFFTQPTLSLASKEDQLEEKFEKLASSLKQALEQIIAAKAEPETVENSSVDTIINDNSTIEDSVMSEQDNKPETVTLDLEATLSTITTAINDLKGEIAEIKAKEIDLSEVKDAIAELKALVSEKTEAPQPVVENVTPPAEPVLAAEPKTNEQELVLASLKEVTEALKEAKEALREAATVPTKTHSEKVNLMATADSSAKLLDELFGQ